MNTKTLPNPNHKPTPSPVYVIMYLDTDSNGDDLLDNAGNLIPAGFYHYLWPFIDEPDAGPFETEFDAGDGIAL